MAPPLVLPFPIREIAFKVGLSAGIGLLVGLEREWSQKEIGVRTFAISGLLHVANRHRRFPHHSK